MASITVRDLVKRFGETLVLDGVDLHVPDGAFAVLVGPSGCGKSTLLRLLAGLEEPNEGAIRFGDDDVTHKPPRERDIAMVFQSYALYPHLTVEKNLSFGLELRKTPPDQIAERVERVSRMLGLDALLQRMPGELSGGQRQRVAMGRAVVRRPRVFMFDEPLSNLDAALRGQVRIDIRRLHAELKTTSVYVTHDQVEAMTLADVMFIMNRGRIEQSGHPLELFSRPATRFVAGFLGSPPMSFVDAVVEEQDGTLFARIDTGDADEQRVRLDPTVYSRAVEAGQTVVLGFRAHEVQLAGADSPIRARVRITEKLGAETHIYATLGKADVTVRADGQADVSADSMLGLEIQPQHLHLFDPETGASWW